MRPSITALALLVLFPGTGAAADTLYARLGGEPVVRSVVERTISEVATDSRFNQSFHKVDIAKLNGRIVEQICMLAGGGCRYTGDDMKQVHAGLDINEREFYALVQALRDALDASGVRDREKNELLRLLAPMKRDVVTK